MVVEPYSAGAELRRADCALGPRTLAKGIESVGKRPAVAPVLAELGAALAERMGASNR
ncbi:MAG TPA: hypothetical protein VEN47_01070 [Myxococcota bacterium]|nr:hypothetical protein [Myxococcota bacterium]